MFNPLPADNRTDSRLDNSLHNPLQGASKSNRLGHAAKATQATVTQPSVAFYTTNKPKNNPDEPTQSLTKSVPTENEKEGTTPKSNQPSQADLNNTTQTDKTASESQEKKAEDSNASSAEVISSSTPALAQGDEQMLCPVDQKLIDFLTNEINDQISTSQKVVNAVATRLAIEVARICRKSARIQASGEVNAWQRSLSQNRVKKYLDYYKLGSRQGRVELHSRLSAIAYRYIAPAKTQLGFQGRCTLLEDFLQGFYIEVLKAFRRENHLTPEYTPRTRLELSEYMAFSEHYAKRRISLPGCYNQQLIVLRAQAFARRLPAETSVDIEMAVDSPKGDDADGFFRSPAIQQIREKMVANTTDPSEAVLRDRIIKELITYLEEQDQHACVDYLTLRLQDMAASEIDEVLGLTSRQRDYLQQRFKYHVEKFAQFHRWELVHQWLGADLDKNFGLSPREWTIFLEQLSEEQVQLLTLKQQQMENPEEGPCDKAIAKALKWTPKRVERRWGKLISLAWKVRNQHSKPVPKPKKP
ncbi:MAG: HetZ-related protein [Cyanobacteria bacterium J06598_3]